MKPHIYKAAIEQATLSEWRYKVGAVIFKKNIIVSTGFNQNRYVAGISEKYCSFVTNMCAEKIAIHSSKVIDISGCDILVVRITNGGNIAMAKPCRSCRELIREVDLRRIFYTDSDGSIRRL